jgi:ketosteroid isomerase-like protein
VPGCALTASDRLDILELLARADSAATRRDVEGYVGLFTDDAVLDGEKGEQRGRDALRLTVGRVWQAEGTDTVHLTLNAVIDQSGSSPDQALATSTLLILRGGSAVSIHSVWTIVQRVVRVQGRWLIERRTIVKN